MTTQRIGIESIEVQLTFPLYNIVRIDNLKRSKIVEIHVSVYTKAKNDDFELKTQK